MHQLLFALVGPIELSHEIIIGIEWVDNITQSWSYKQQKNRETEKPLFCHYRQFFQQIVYQFIKILNNEAFYYKFLIGLKFIIHFKYAQLSIIWLLNNQNDLVSHLLIVLLINLLSQRLYFYKQLKQSNRMDQPQSLRAAFMRPVFSPRSEMSRYLSDIEKNKISLTINIDKQTLGLFKNQFDYNDNKVDKATFVAIGLKILKSWQKQMQFRESRMIKYLLSLFEEIENKLEQTYITWEQFNNLIIEKALNLKSLQSQDSSMVSQLKYTNWEKGRMKLITPIRKIVCMNRQKKLAFLCQQSNKIEFLSLANNQHNYKPLILQRQDLLVEKTLVKRVKNQGSKTVTKQNYKKKVVVAGYNVTFLDMIYVNSEKYQMLITSSSDGVIRGWDIHGTIPALAKQPENQQEKMIHQFSVEVHCMAWDQINDILYCSANDSKIYLWMVKTDSQKQLYDPSGHKSMISSMIMMPKLQFLATGDYDGKLILWDTISMNKKYKYEEHTRSIVSMTFHEALILLFTASYDHSICVWNPYIPSLIYKISCNINVIQVQIIPGTNYLAALDQASNLKIRQISKFNLISTYVVDRPDDNQINKASHQGSDSFQKIQPMCIGVSENPIRFFFGGNSIKCMQFDENQALSSSEYFPTIIKYHPKKLKMYVVIKNSILVWDMLTGQLYDVLHLQSQNQIAAIDLIQNTDKIVIGDSQGSVQIRKLQNGIKLSRLYKHRHKISVGFIVSKLGGLWNQSVIACSFLDGQIAIFGKDDSYGYGLLRSFNIRKNFPNSLISAIQYEEKRNLLVISTNTGEIVYMDVDKSRITNQIEAKSLQIIKFQIRNDIPSLVGFGKNSQVLGIYLPPHSKKFKFSCNLTITRPKSALKVVSVAISKTGSNCFIGYQNGLISHVLLREGLINDQKITTKQVKKIDPQWQINFSETPKDLALIVDQTVLAIILYLKNITLISARDGETLNILNSYTFSPKVNFYQNPLCYYSQSSIHERPRDRSIDKFKQDRQDIPKQKFQSYSVEKMNKHQFYIPEQKRYCNFQISNSENKNTELQVFHDPFFLYDNFVKFVNGKKKEKDVRKTKNSEQLLLMLENQNRIVWNKQWKIFPEFREISAKNFQQMIKTQIKVRQLIAQPVKRLNRNNSTNAQIKRAVNAQKKWQKVKQQIEDDYRKTKTKILSLSTFKFPSSLNQKKNQSEDVLKTKLNSEDVNVRLTKHQSLYRNESSPFIRLGLALQKINDRDEKALKFIKMGQKTEQQARNVKLPKIQNRSSHNN